MQGHFISMAALPCRTAPSCTCSVCMCTQMYSTVQKIRARLCRRLSMLGVACAHLSGVQQVVELFEWGRHPRDHLRRVEVIAQRSSHLQATHSICDLLSSTRTGTPHRHRHMLALDTSCHSTAGLQLLVGCCVHEA